MLFVAIPVKATAVVDSLDGFAGRVVVPSVIQSCHVQLSTWSWNVSEILGIMAPVRYLGCLIVHDSHTVKQPNRISPKVLTAMGAQQTLEPDYRGSHLPFSILHFDPVHAHPLEWHLGSVCRPSIHCNGDFSGSRLSGQWWWVRAPNARDEHLRLSPPLASSCASQTDCEGVLSHRRWLGDRLSSISDASTLAHCRMRSCQQALEAIIKGALFCGNGRSYWNLLDYCLRWA